MATIEARIVSVQKDTSREPPWYRITTDHDRVKRLDTQHDDKAKEAYELMQAGEPALIEFTSRPRTLEDGRTFQNYYYDTARLLNGHGATASIEIPEMEQPAASGSRGTEDLGRAWRIALQCGAKLAVQSIPHLEAKGFSTGLVDQQQVALAWATWLFYTTAPARPSQGAATLGGATLGDFDPGPEPGAREYPDDDIPF